VAEPRRRFDAPSLDGLRAVAFGLVFASHVPGWKLFPGGFGVTVFFFLSGYLITTLLRLELDDTGRIDVPAFFGRRILRILPPYFLILAGIWILALLGAWGPRPASLEPLAWQIGFLTNFWIVGHGAEALPPGTEVFWSLAVEEHFYLVFPFVALALFRWVPARGRGQALLALCGLVLLWRLLLFFVLSPGDADRLTYATDTRIDSILFGCVLALLHNPVLDPPGAWVKRGGWALTAACAALVLTLVPRDPVFRETVRYTMQGLLLIPVYTVLLGRPDLRVVRWLSHPWLRWLGVLTYTLYLVHDSLIALVRFWLPGAPSPVVAALALAASITVAVTVHRLVERPLARWRARLRTGVLSTDRQAR
jgi:peptidoglycan/LPS O-acetylase OafA/YrhL